MVSRVAERYRHMKRVAERPQRVGCVFLVGAGPGDPGLITLRGVDCLREADVVIYDRLAHPSLLEYAPADAERIDAGKRAGRHTLRQATIERLMIARAKEGKRIVRLKGGDPMLFGRGGEEAQALAAARIPFEIVPGVSSLTAVPAYAGIPLTHRDYASSVAVVTGHEDPRKPSSHLAWPHLATGVDTLVCLMGVRQLPEMARQLLKNGRSPSSPCAVIEWGTLPRQRTITGTLATVARQARVARLHPPAIFLVGNVVRLRRSLNWFETRPLFGTRVLVTRPHDQASPLSERLSRLGAEAIILPAIEAVPLDDYAALDQAIHQLDRYHWLFFTSAVGVEYFLRRLRFLRKDVRALGGLKLGAIGPKTAQALRRLGLLVDFIPEDSRQEGMLTELLPETVRGRRMLIVRAAQARDVLPDGLRQMGASVDIVPVYRTLPPPSLRRQLASLDGAPIIITFTSSSCAHHLWAALPPSRRRSFFKRATLASIGPVTSATLKAYQLPVHVQAKASTVESLVDAIVAHVSRRRAGARGKGRPSRRGKLGTRDKHDQRHGGDKGAVVRAVRR